VFFNTLCGDTYSFVKISQSLAENLLENLKETVFWTWYCRLDSIWHYKN